MPQGVIYIVGIIIAIILLLLFLRSILRQKLTAIQAANNTPTLQFHHSRSMDVVRPQAAVTNRPRVVIIPTIPLSRTQTHESDQLPRYEAPPPGYDVVVKDLERGDIVGGDERGGPSRAAAAPPGYGVEDRGEEGGGGVYGGPVNRPEVARDPDAGRAGLFRVDVRRAWGGFGR